MDGGEGGVEEISHTEPWRISTSLNYSGASLVAQLVKNLPAMQETQFNSWVGKIPWRKNRLPTPVFLGFPGGSVSKESTFHAGDLDSIPGSGRLPGEGHGNPIQYSYLENPMHRGAWQAAIQGVTESDMTEQLSTN